MPITEQNLAQKALAKIHKILGERVTFLWLTLSTYWSNQCI